jgi:hypothetical protein
MFRHLRSPEAANEKERERENDKELFMEKHNKVRHEQIRDSGSVQNGFPNTEVARQPQRLNNSALRILLA